MEGGTTECINDLMEVCSGKVLCQQESEGGVLMARRLCPFGLKGEHGKKGMKRYPTGDIFSK